MAKKKVSHKYKPGLIVAIPLPDGRYAFAKLFKDFDLGVYSLVSDKIETVENIVKHDLTFFQAATDSAIKSGEWPIVGEELFSDEDSSWGPPRAAGILPQDEMGYLDPQLSYKGSERPAKLRELIGLDIESFCQRPELFIQVVVDRLIKGDHTKYRVQP